MDLLRAAEMAFVERGLDRATVAEITRRAGRSKGSFYLHFESKEDAFRQIVLSMLARLESYVAEAGRVAEAERTVRDVGGLLDTWLDLDLQIFEFVWQNRGVFRLMLEGGKSPAFAFLIDEFAERARASTALNLERGIVQGIYRADLDVQVASLMISASYDRLARELVRSERRPDLRSRLRGLQQLIFRGIASAGAAAMIDQWVINQSEVVVIEEVAVVHPEEARRDRRARNRPRDP